MVKVSVIIPVYNQEKYLRQCMDSVVAQTLRDIEIICVDDGSTDASLAILKEYEKSDSRVSVITQQNSGAGAARNRGLDVARGSYLSFLDSDDYFEPDMLETAYAAAEMEKADMTVFGSNQYREDLRQYFSVDWTIKRDELPPYRPMNYRTFTDNVFKVFVGWAWDKLFRADFVREQGLRFQELRTSNDMYFVFMATVLAGRIETVDRVLAHQRRSNPESLSNTRERSWDCFYRALMHLRDGLIEHGLYDELEQDYINYALHFSLWNYDTITGPKKRVLRDKLLGEWFDELGITGRDEGYFYDKYEYDEYRHLIKHMS